ncbi:toxin co-regulated pilus biosynthesis Q family protein [Salmonella enterica]|nr:toxin co-regulated pilus biosynthesis Q family protein [Salmonella enterica]
MINKKVFIVALAANAITACSSPPKLTEPDGDWISFDVPQPQQVTPQPAKIRNSFAAGSTNPQISAVSDKNEIRPLLTSSTSTLPVLVKSDGKNVPLYKALKTIVPDSMTVRLAPDVAQTFRSSVSWSGGDQWPHVLQKMLDVNGLKADVNSSRREVIVQYAQKVSIPTQASHGKLAQPTGTVADKSPVAVLKTPLIPKLTEGTKPVMPDKSTPQLKHDSVIKVAPLAKPAPIFKLWTMEKGTTLKAGYMAWASKENCPVGKGKWSVRWDTDTDYPIDYPLRFTGKNFEDVTDQLFDFYRRTQAPLYVIGYRPQCLIVISDKK